MAGPGLCSASGCRQPDVRPALVRLRQTRPHRRDTWLWKSGGYQPRCRADVGWARPIISCLLGGGTKRMGRHQRRWRGAGTPARQGDLGVSELDSKRQQSLRFCIPKPGPKRGATSTLSCAQRPSVLQVMRWGLSFPVGMPAGFQAPRPLSRVASLPVGHLRPREPNSWTSGLKFFKKLGFQRWAMSSNANVTVPVQNLPMPGAGFASSPADRDYGEQGLGRALPEPEPGPIKEILVFEREKQAVSHAVGLGFPTPLCFNLHWALFSSLLGVREARLRLG